MMYVRFPLSFRNVEVLLHEQLSSYLRCFGRIEDVEEKFDIYLRLNELAFWGYTMGHGNTLLRPI